MVASSSTFRNLFVDRLRVGLAGLVEEPRQVDELERGRGVEVRVSASSCGVELRPRKALAVLGGGSRAATRLRFGDGDPPLTEGFHRVGDELRADCLFGRRHQAIALRVPLEPLADAVYPACQDGAPRARRGPKRPDVASDCWAGDVVDRSCRARRIAHQRRHQAGERRLRGCRVQHAHERAAACHQRLRLHRAIGVRRDALLAQEAVRVLQRQSNGRCLVLLNRMSHDQGAASGEPFGLSYRERRQPLLLVILPVG
jgi:hypothetical protein